MTELLEKYYLFLEDPEIIIALIDLLPYHIQYIFVRHLWEVKEWFIEGDYMTNQQGIIRIEDNSIIAENDSETKVLVNLPEAWEIES